MRLNDDPKRLRKRAPGWPNFCACVVTAQTQPAGQKCVECMVSAATGPCWSDGDACIADQGCMAVMSCLQKCQANVDCIRACILPMDDTPGKKKYAAVAACQCTACAPECDTYAATPVCALPKDAGAD